MKKLTLAMLLALFGAAAMAQNFEGSTLEERIAFSTGDNEDTIKTAKGYLTMFQQTNANKDYQDMYENYKWIKTYAPFAQNGIYTQGPFMFYNLINAEQDPVKKRKYFDESDGGRNCKEAYESHSPEECFEAVKERFRNQRRAELVAERLSRERILRFSMSIPPFGPRCGGRSGSRVLSRVIGEITLVGVLAIELLGVPVGVLKGLHDGVYIALGYYAARAEPAKIRHQVPGLPGAAAAVLLIGAQDKVRGVVEKDPLLNTQRFGQKGIGLPPLRQAGAEFIVLDRAERKPGGLRKSTL